MASRDLFRLDDKLIAILLLYRAAPAAKPELATTSEISICLATNAAKDNADVQYTST